MRALIFSGGQIADYDAVRPYLSPADLVVAADSGARHALALGLVPDLAVGDFDSGGPELLAQLRSMAVPVQTMPREKDLTDTHLAVRAALERGATELVLLGATGDRLDHTIANLLLLPGLPGGVSAIMVDSKNVIHLLAGPGRLQLAGRAGDFVSLLPLSPRVDGISTDGLKYALTDASLVWGESVGTSNEMVGPAAGVAAAAGHLLVIQSRD